MNENRYHLLGIGGSGMLPLALLLGGSGRVVSGSDRSFDRDPGDERASFLREAGVALGAQGSGGGRGAVVVVSTAIEPDHPDLAGALRVVHRSEALRDLVTERDSPSSPATIMVAGSSGKTTTTSMIAWILQKTGRDPLIYVGGEIEGLAPRGARIGRGTAVLEIDESDGSIERFTPDCAVVTSVSEDHKPLPEIERMLRDFLGRARSGIVSAQASRLSSTTAVAPSLDRPATRLFGRFNRVNEALAVCAAARAGIKAGEALEALASFPGVARRLQVLYDDGRRLVVDDFAHNPEKIEASLEALREKSARRFVIFQPHGYGPTRMHRVSFARVFSESLGADDVLCLLPIFDAGGTADRSVRSEDLGAIVKGPRVECAADAEAARSLAREFLAGGGLAVVMGARDPRLALLARTLAAEAKVSEGRHGGSETGGSRSRKTADRPTKEDVASK